MKKFVILWIGILFSAQFAGAKTINIEVTNPLDESRFETVSVDLAKIGKFKYAKPAVYCENFKRFIACQVIDNDSNGTNDELVFQAEFKARQVLLFDIVEANVVNEVEVLNGAIANYIQQRKDDFAWENDKIAFRMYGQELQRTELTSSGIDVWVKKVGRPVMLDLYKKGHGFYHADNPMGIDFFNVGPTLGCGGLGVWHNGKLLLSENYNEWKIIANGPIRVIFELTYKPWDIGDGRKVGEVKRISLDKGWNFNRIESKFNRDVNDTTFAVGIVKCERDGKEIYGPENQYLGYWQKEDKKFGIIGCGVVLTKDSITYKSAEDEKNYMLLAKAKKNSVVYYAGAGWNKNPGFETEDKWILLIRKIKRQINNPLKVEIKK
ncbi:MAG: hypothetical protein A2Y10_06215 [Planctomycetes bacterium GWF2_41_51]|nr:MAG: hypothetical protein A2Y10_06215 [Planctomycetes bacterium GWF2_41_51]